MNKEIYKATYICKGYKYAGNICLKKKTYQEDIYGEKIYKKDIHREDIHIKK